MQRESCIGRIDGIEMNNAEEQKLQRSKPHICLYIGSLQKGGAERVMTNLAEHLYVQGWQVTMVTTYFRPPEYALPHGLWDASTGEPYGEECETVSWGRQRSAQIQPAGIRRIYSDPPQEELEKGRLHGFRMRYRTLRSIWEQEKPDIILSFIGYNNIFALLTSRGLGIPVAVSVRSNPSREYASRKLRIPAMALFRQAAGVILQTEEAKRFFPEAIQRKACILPNALNPDFIRPVYEGERTCEVVSVGRLDENKNEALLLRAFAGTREQHPEYVLRLYGDGPARKSLEALTQELGMTDCVVFEGVVDQVRTRIERSRIYVLSSKEEGMPNALLEAMSAGLACVSTDCPCGGPRELITHGRNGLLVPVDDVPAMTAALLQLMEHPEDARQMGMEASRVQETYNLEAVNRRWEEYLAGLI